MAGANTSAHAVALNRAFVREPFLPEPSRWNDVRDMLCGHCVNKAGCGLVEAMLAFAQGRTGVWPENAWVTDQGTSATCLSYAPIRAEPISRERLEALARTPEEALPHVCGGCAAKKGSEASVALHTQRDYRAAVRDQSEFTCHEDPENKRLCGGWCRAVQRKEG